MKTYHNEKDKELAAHTLDLTLSDNKHFTSEEDILQTPLTVTWLLRSMHDLSTSKAAMCLSSGERERDFSIASQDQIFIVPPSDPDHMSPGSKHQQSKTSTEYTTASHRCWKNIMLHLHAII